MYDFSRKYTHRCSAGRSKRLRLAATAADVENAENKKWMRESFDEQQNVHVAPLESAWKKIQHFYEMYVNNNKYKSAKIDSHESTKSDMADNWN